MKRVLDKKLLRDLAASSGVMLTVIAIITVGTASFVGFGTAQRILEDSQRAYYEDYRFAHLWVDVKKAPLTAVEQIAELSEVGSVQSRIVFNVILDLPAVDEPLVGRLISAPARPEHMMNGLCLVQGSGFSVDRDEEVILSESFASAHGLKPGDQIEMILNLKRESFVIAGTAISPEYVYMVQGEGDLLPDPEHFGILYMEDTYARQVLDFQDSCNQITVLLAPHYAADPQAVLGRVDRILAPYGVLSSITRQRQASHRFLSDEIAGLSVTSVIIPSILLSVAALALNLFMSRLVQRQRTIIGTLKALGYGNRRIVMHFVSFGAVLGLIGGFTGDLGGLALAGGLIEIYRDFYQFPRFVFVMAPDLMLIGLLISIAFAILGTLRGVRAVTRLQPAEAMRPRPPRKGGRVFLERLPALWRRLDFRSQIAMRTVIRNSGRTLTGLISSVLAASIVLLTLAMYASMLYLVDFQFEQVAHSDIDLGLRDDKGRSALLEAQDLPGVDYAEPVLGLSCDLRRGRHSRRLTITGLSHPHRLTTPRQADLTPLPIPPRGLVMSRKLAELFAARPQDRFELTPVRGRRQPLTVHLAAVTDSFLGLDCYADIEYLSGLVGESFAVNAVQLEVNPRDRQDLFRKIKRLPNVQGLGIRANTVRNIQDTVVKTSLFSLGMMIVLAGVLSLGSTLNSALMELQDRTQEIATLRVMGYSATHIAGIFLRQNLFIAVIGFILAIPFGYAMTLLMSRAYDTELYRLPVVFEPSMIALTAVLYFSFTALAQLFVYRQIAKLDWLEGVQVKE